MRALEAQLLQFDKRDHSKNQEHNSNDIRPGEILAIIIAALTLLVAVVPLFRSSRFRLWVSSFSISPPVRKAPGTTLPNPGPRTVTTMEDLSAIPIEEITIPSPVFIYYPNAHFAGTRVNTFAYGPDFLPGEDYRAPEVGESPELRRPEPVVS